MSLPAESSMGTGRGETERRKEGERKERRNLPAGSSFFFYTSSPYHTSTACTHKRNYWQFFNYTNRSIFSRLVLKG